MEIQKGGIYARFLKRPIDFILALLAIIVLSPIFIVVAFLVRTKLGSPVIFQQPRPGIHGQVFTMFKFRTMTSETDEFGQLLPDDIRLTTFGKALRSTSLDELPELFNILRGEMAIVGPRPQLVRDMVFMTKEQNKRHNILPGLTGWAQVNGRNNISWEEKLTLDLDYLNNITFLNDLKIIFLTIKKVFIKDGIASDGFETAEDLGDYLLRLEKIDKVYYEKQIEKSKILLRGKN